MEFRIEVVKVFPWSGDSHYYWEGVNGEDVRDLVNERGWTEGWDYEIDGRPADIINENGRFYAVPEKEAWA